MDRQRISFVLGERLKELREERGLTHAGLIKQLSEKYGVSVSRDSIMAYEISDESRAKADKLPNLGMRVEYLYCLADFYGVSLDYLLGKTAVKTADCSIQVMAEYTGLSEMALNKLNDLNIDTQQPPTDVLYYPNCFAIFMETLLDSTTCKRLNDYLLTAAQMMLIQKRFWEQEIEGYSSLSKRDQYRERERWMRKDSKWRNHDFNNDMFLKIVDPDFLIEMPIWTAEAAQNQMTESLLRAFSQIARNKCFFELERRVNDIEARERGEKGNGQ